MKPRNPLKVTAKVQVTLELVGGLGSWDTQCPAEQIFSQASEAAIKQINRMVNADSTPRGLVRIVGDPIVKAIMSEEERN